MNTENVIKKITVILILQILASVVLGKEKKFTLKEIHPFTLQGVDSKLYTNKDLIGERGTLLIFLSNHCKISQIFQKKIVEHSEEWKSGGIKILVFSPNFENAILPDELAYSDSGDSYEEMKERALSEKYNFPYIYDGKEQIVTKSLEVKITPSAYLYDNSGKLIYSGRLGNHEKPEEIKNGELNQNIKRLIKREKVEFNRTRNFGTAIKFKKDLHLAENVKRRYSGETIQINYADERRLNFFIGQKTNYPKFFYIWSLHESQKQNRENLITISSNYKIFRKRGLKVYTICICKDEEREDALELLKQAQLSSYNYYTLGKEITEISKLRSYEGNKTTPFCRLLTGDNKFKFGTNGLIENKILTVSFLQTLNAN